MAFNPREALERIRQNKAAAALPVQRTIDDPFVDSSPQLLFDDSKLSDVRERVLLPTETTSAVGELSKKVENLEKITRDLARDLSDSNIQIERLRREKSELQTHILKLEYENNQIRNSSKANQALREIKLKRQTPEKEVEEKSPVQRTPKLTTSSVVNNSSSNIKHSAVNNRSQQSIVGLPEEVLQPVLKQSIDSVLHRKERNFKVIKNAASTRQQLIKAGTSHLSQLASIMKQYPEMERPVLVIALDENEFQ